MSGWQNSTRRQRLPPGWSSRIVPRILRRDPVCMWPGCTAPSTEVDHVVNNDDHSYSNLQGLCSRHHQAKTQAEAAAARARNPRPTARRTPEPHPGQTRT